MSAPRSSIGGHLKRLYTSFQAAKYLGISRMSLYRLAIRREISWHRILTYRRYSKEDMDKYLRRIHILSKYDLRQKRRGRKSNRRKRT
ncbi:MAG: excisionase family DNA-binding protein [Planctomycetes bacterium]|nr:excisionase family DNA-binding protein [Planctomycetota bacterium]